MAKDIANNEDITKQFEKYLSAEDSKKLDSIDFLGLAPAITKFIANFSLLPALPCYLIEEKL